MYRGELGDEDQRAATLRADIAALETKLAAAREVADKLAVEERRGVRRKLRPLLRWWGIVAMVLAFGIGMVFMFSVRGLDKVEKDPCEYLKGIPITVPAR